MVNNNNLETPGIEPTSECRLTNFAIRSFIAGGIAACGAVTVTHGFETVKIRSVRGRLSRNVD